MKPHRWVLLAILIVAAILSYRCVQWLRWRERADSATGVALELRPARQVIKVGERPELTVTIVNRGDQEVMLVEPGDGSDCGWQTPLIEWSRRRWFRGPRCGNTNGLKPEEVFVLKPGESRQLNGWVGTPYLSGPGRYRVAIRYENRPDHEWVGVPLEEHDQNAMRKVHRSTPVSMVSNAVEIVVEN